MARVADRVQLGGPLTFAVYAVLRPVGTALILGAMVHAVAGQATGAAAFTGFYVANAFHEYVVRVLVGMGWIVVEEREDYETLRYVYASPVGIVTYLTGRSAVKFWLATVSVAIVLGLGWIVLGVRWDPAAVRWAPLVAAVACHLAATLFAGFLVGGAALVLPRNAISLNEGVGIALYLLCGVIFPIDLLPHGLRELSLALPFTYAYEAIRRFLLGRSASHLLGAWPDAALLGALALTTLVLGAVSIVAFRALDRRARRLGRLDHSTLF